MSKIQAHTRYRNKANDVVPSITTVINTVLAKPQLIVWANKLGLQGIDSTKVRDAMGNAGALAHYFILCHLKGESPDTSEYSQETINLAENSFLSYLEWEKHHSLKPILLETPLVSESLRVGGTPDFYGYVDGELVLADYKTGGIYKEAFIQTCAYCRLLGDNDYQLPEKIIVLGIPRSENENFREEVYKNYDLGNEIFSHLRALYDLMKEVK